ncbi:MAG TPA: multidrug ABC transporter ATP-binding protein [Elusimicrobia bacterium]|nr:multidrug ABC transporter ATP-binding protein [Elusimicrobiota bacterium]
MGSIIIEVDALRREFDETLAVDGVSFSVEEGAVFALVGPNGAGKTTLMRMLAALLEPSSGTARINGMDIREQPRAVHSLLGFLPDFYGLYDELAICEYLRFFYHAYRLPREMIGRRIEEIQAHVGLEGYGDRQIGTLSRGMRQKLSLARAILHDPKILLLDEPAGGLDLESREEMQALLKGLARTGKTIIVSSHILSELEDYCSHVAMMDQGRLLFAGSLTDARRRLPAGRRFRLRAAAGVERAVLQLEAQGGVSHVERHGSDVVFEFDGDQPAVAEVVKALVGAGVSLTHFSEAAGTIQDSYNALMKGSR